MKENITISDDPSDKSITENSKHITLKGKLEDVRGYIGEVSIDLKSLSPGDITGFVEVSIISDETPTIFKGKIIGSREKDRIRLSYHSDSADSPIGFSYEGNLVDLGRGVGMTGSYKADTRSRSAFLKAGVLALVETQGLPASHQSMSINDSSDQNKTNIANPFRGSRVKV